MCAEAQRWAVHGFSSVGHVEPGGGPVEAALRAAERRAATVVGALAAQRANHTEAAGGSHMTTVAAARSVATWLPRTTEGVVRDRIKFRVGRIVYVAFSRDETVMGFAFPKAEREALVTSAPEKFMLPSTADQRYNWVLVRLDAIDDDELRELVVDAWRMAVPQRVAAEYDAQT